MRSKYVYARFNFKMIRKFESETFTIDETYKTKVVRLNKRSYLRTQYLVVNELVKTISLHSV